MEKSGALPTSIRARLIFSLLLPLANMLYLASNRIIAGRGSCYIWKASIDEYIPFIAIAVIPYIWWYFQILISLVWFITTRKSPGILYKYVSSIALVTLISTIIFIVMPTHVPRPQISGSDPFSALVRFIYSIDEPYNCFPSLHVAYATISVWYWHNAGPKQNWFRIFNIISFVSICLATVLTKQHYYPDIPGGLIVAIAAMAVVEYAYKKVLKTRAV